MMGCIRTYRRSFLCSPSSQYVFGAGRSRLTVLARQVVVVTKAHYERRSGLLVRACCLGAVLEQCDSAGEEVNQLRQAARKDARVFASHNTRGHGKCLVHICTPTCCP
jgi:hypothetical protein